MLTEIALFLILSLVCVKIFVSKVSASLLRKKFPMILSFYRHQELNLLEQKVMTSRKLRVKLEYYFPSGLPSEDLQERFKALDWFLSQSKNTLMVKSPDQTLETWDINQKYKEFQERFYHYYGFYPTLDDESMVEDYELNLSWDDYQNTIEWSQLSIMVWIVETGILDYFDNNFEFIETKFIESQTGIQMIDVDEVIQEDEEESLKEDQNQDQNQEQQESPKTIQAKPSIRIHSSV